MVGGGGLMRVELGGCANGLLSNVWGKVGSEWGIGIGRCGDRCGIVGVGFSLGDVLRVGVGDLS